MSARNLLFLCTGNACRSQMAEGWAKTLFSGSGVTIESAGIEAHGLNQTAVQVMHEVGIDIASQQSTIIDTSGIKRFDLVVTVCGHADEQCPVLPPGCRKLHWPLPDPAKFEGSPEAVLEEFRRVRDDIQQRVLTLRETLIPAHRSASEKLP